MEKVFINGIGDMPAKIAMEIEIGDRVVVSSKEMGRVTSLEYHEDYVRMCLLDSFTKTEFSVNKRKSNLVGFIPQG